jgi:hypothetical protein
LAGEQHVCVSAIILYVSWKLKCNAPERDSTAKWPAFVLLSFIFFARRDDFGQPAHGGELQYRFTDWPEFCGFAALWGKMASCGRLVIGLCKF